MLRQIAKGLDEAVKRLDPLDKDLKSASVDGEKMLKINKNHAALTSALGACATARKILDRVSVKAIDISQECHGLKSYEPVGS